MRDRQYPRRVAAGIAAAAAAVVGCMCRGCDVEGGSAVRERILEGRHWIDEGGFRIGVVSVVVEGVVDVDIAAGVGFDVGAGGDDRVAVDSGVVAVGATWWIGHAVVEDVMSRRNVTG